MSLLKIEDVAHVRFSAPDRPRAIPPRLDGLGLRRGD